MPKVISGWEINDCEDWITNRPVYMRAVRNMDFERTRDLMKIIENVDRYAKKMSIIQVEVRRHPTTGNKQWLEGALTDLRNAVEELNMQAMIARLTMD